MEAIIFIGLQASGKSTFYRRQFFDTHVRISMDLLSTRHRERCILEACLATETRVVIDNTNPTREERARYIELLRARRYRIIGYYFSSPVAECLERNLRREGKARIPNVGLLGTAKKLQKPSLDEGFDELCYVKLENGAFVVQPWQPDDL
ncbi:MAG: AAA family ATPase [Verrucomicrobiota bacterium JB022]|nr:AAA family ATPase [Verrucomicrobiota bacterium JB022]